MQNKDLIYILTILEAIEKISIYTNRFDNSDQFYWENDQLNFNATVNLLIAVGEESKKISSDLKNPYANVNWRSLAGLRDKIAHDYRGIDPQIVWSVITDNLPELKTVVTDMFYSLKINREIIAEIINSEYYKHLKYLIK